MNLSQILDDEKTFADAIEITVNGEKHSLGDLRALSRAKQKDLSDKIAATEHKRAEVLELAEQAATLKSNLEQQLADAGKRGNPSNSDLDDPFFAPVKKAFDGRDSEIKELKGTLEKLNNAANQMAKIWAEDRWQGQYEKSKTRLKGDKAKEWTYEKVRDFAGTNKILDSYGLPNIEKAIQQLTQEDERQDIEQAAYERGLKEGQVKGRMNVMPRPTSASGGKPPAEKSAVAERGLEGLGDDVAEDKDLMRMLSDLGAVQPEDLLQ